MTDIIHLPPEEPWGFAELGPLPKELSKEDMQTTGEQAKAGDAAARQKFNDGYLLRLLAQIKEALVLRETRGVERLCGSADQYDLFNVACLALSETDDKAWKKAKFPLTWMHDRMKGAIDDWLDAYDVRRGRGPKRKDLTKTKPHTINRPPLSSDEPGVSAMDQHVAKDSEEKRQMDLEELREGLIAKGEDWVEHFIDFSVSHYKGTRQTKPTLDEIAPEMGWSYRTAQENVAALIRLAKTIVY